MRRTTATQLQHRHNDPSAGCYDHSYSYSRSSHHSNRSGTSSGGYGGSFNFGPSPHYSSHSYNSGGRDGRYGGGGAGYSAFGAPSSSSMYGQPQPAATPASPRAVRRESKKRPRTPCRAKCCGQGAPRCQHQAPAPGNEGSHTWPGDLVSGVGSMVLGGGVYLAARSDRDLSCNLSSLQPPASPPRTHRALDPPAPPCTVCQPRSHAQKQGVTPKRDRS